MVKSFPNLPLVVLAEDDPDDRLLLREAFAETGFAVDLLMVADGEALVELLAGPGERPEAMGERMPALVICDINMPRMSGLEALRALRDKYPFDELPVVMLTSSRAEEDRTRSIAFGASAHRVKPSSFSGLVELVRELLRAHIRDAGEYR